MSHPHNSHFGVTGPKPHFAINRIGHITLYATVVLLRHLDIYLFFLFFFWWLDYRCNFSWTFPPHFAKIPVLLLHPKLASAPNLASFLRACQSLNESRLYTNIIWVAVNHEPAINYAAIWPMGMDCLDLISRAPRSFDGWRSLTKW